MFLLSRCPLARRQFLPPLWCTHRCHRPHLNKHNDNINMNLLERGEGWGAGGGGGGMDF